MSETSLLKQVANFGPIFALAIVGSFSASATAQSGGSPSQPSAAARAASESPALRFEVATIKPSPYPAMNGINVYPGGRVEIKGATLKGLIAIAFNLAHWQVSGGEGWESIGQYDLEAKPPEELRERFTNLRHSLFTIEDPKLQAMLQSLLIERFQMKFHRETKTGDVYLLELSGKPIKLKPALDHTAGDNAIMTPGYWEIGFVDGHFSILNTSMPQLAQFASTTVLGSSVIDRTGLTGSYDYYSPIGREQSEFQDSFKELIPELGLKLERAKGEVETFVIDHAERPSPN
jgi:uncharacterized protein (TIGR03435 family)